MDYMPGVKLMQGNGRHRSGRVTSDEQRLQQAKYMAGKKSVANNNVKTRVLPVLNIAPVKSGKGFGHAIPLAVNVGSS